MLMYSERAKSLMSRGLGVGIAYFRAGNPIFECATMLGTVLNSQLIKIHSAKLLLQSL